jgi:hypothetical protein
MFQSCRSDCNLSHHKFIDVGSVEGDEECAIVFRSAVQSRFDCATKLERLVLTLQVYSSFMPQKPVTTILAELCILLTTLFE